MAPPRKNWAKALAIPLLLTSCATSPPTRQESQAEIETLLRNAEKRKSVSGMVLVTSELEGHSVSTPAVILVEWPDKFRLELQDPVGGLIALLVLNGERFWLYESARAEVLTGPVKKLPFGMIPLLQTEDLVRFLLARPSSDQLRKSKMVEGVAKFRDRERSEALRWSGNNPEPEEWRIAFPGKAKSGANYEEYEFKSGLRYPAKIHLDGAGADGKEKKILIVWKDWDVNVPKEKKLFQIPQQQTFGRKIKALP